MRLLLFADVHLDTPFAWADRAVARLRRQALRDTLARIVDLAATVEADALLCAGDLYEHERFAPDTGAFLRQRFAEADRPVLIAPGNHDWYGRESLYATIAWPEHVHVFTEAQLRPVALGGDVIVWGAAHRASSGTGDFFAGADAGAAGAGRHLALVHASERSGLAWQGEDKQPHAPFDEAAVPAAGFLHALCGHYHRPREGTHHTYPGNPEPLSFGEDGVRGAVVVDVADDRVDRRWEVMAGTAWHDITVDVTGAQTADDVRDRAREAVGGLAGVARVTVTGELHPDADLRPERDLTAGALGLAAGDLEAVTVRTIGLRAGYDIDALTTEDTITGQFVRDVLADEAIDDDERHRVLTVGLRALDGRDDLEVR